MEIIDLSSDKKTIYTIVDEDGDKSSITVDKWVADLLQGLLPDVHKWIQSKYDRVNLKYPKMTRREKGNLVRAVAEMEAKKSSDYKRIEDYLGGY